MAAPDINEINKKKPPPEWATFIHDRSPQFKPHASIGHAKNALRGNIWQRGKYVTGKGYPMNEGYVYRAVNGVWELAYTIQQGDYAPDHPFWQVAPKSRQVSNSAVEQAIASIVRTASK